MLSTHEHCCRAFHTRTETANHQRWTKFCNSLKAWSFGALNQGAPGLSPGTSLDNPAFVLADQAHWCVEASAVAIERPIQAKTNKAAPPLHAPRLNVPERYVRSRYPRFPCFEKMAGTIVVECTEDPFFPITACGRAIAEGVDSSPTSRESGPCRGKPA